MKRERTVTVGLIVMFFLIVVVVFIVVSAFDTKADGNTPKRVYECDYSNFSLNTKFTTVLNDKKVVISGNIMKLITDPLKMVDEDGNLIGEVTDSYNFISQDDHTIIVDNKVECVLSGDIAFGGEHYIIYNDDKMEVGKLDSIFSDLRAKITDTDGNIIAVLKRGFFEDFTIEVYEDDKFSDEAILLMFSAYRSDVLADEENSSN